MKDEDKEKVVMYFISGLKNGGVEKLIENYTKELMRNNFEFIIVYQHQPIADELKYFEGSGIRCIRIPSKTRHPLRNILATKQVIKEYNPDIVHTHMNLMNFFPLFVAWMQDIPIRICHSHIANNNIGVPFLDLLFKKMNLLFANVFFACGKSAGDYMYGKKEYEIIYNAIPQEKFRFNEEERKYIRNKFNIDNETLLIGNIGRVTNQKNQIFLVDIFEEYIKNVDGNCKLLIIGTGENNMLLKNKINKSKEKENIIWLKKAEKIYKYYSAMDCFLLPSIYEGLPLVGVEAQCSGLNVIVASSIDKTMAFTPNVSFLDLNAGSEYWAKNIVQSKYRNNVFKNEYDIKFASKKLIHLYDKIISRKKV